MTAIIGVETKRGTFLGADSCLTYGYSMSSNPNKLMRFQNFALAGAGAHRTLQLLQYSKNKFKAINEERDVFKFGNRLRKMLTKDCVGYSGDEFNRMFAIILAAPCGLYLMHDGFEFSRETSCAMGSGGNFLLGFVQGQMSAGMKPQKAIREGMKATAQRTISVGGKTHIIRV